MNSDILALVFDLKDKIIKSDLYIDLKNKEKIMLDDIICSKLLYEFQKAQDNYNESKRFEKYGSNIQEFQKILSEKKSQVYENKLVKEYLNAYNKFKIKLKEIEKIIFENITK